jgi:predicted glycoside hydrolase/deacetylase ChbG (UPF0249 family)
MKPAMLYAPVPRHETLEPVTETPNHREEVESHPSSGQRYLIVHADDFGLTRAVSEGIVRAHGDGIVTSASIMAVGAAFDHAVALWRETPSLDVGVHLTLVEERPLTSPRRIPSLVTPAGRFHPHAMAFTKRYLLGAISLDEVRLELVAQLERVLEQGIPVSHLDSHQHLHMLPGIFALTVELAGHYAIPAVRIVRERVPLAPLKGPRAYVRAAQLTILNALARRNAPCARHLFTTDRFVGFMCGGALDHQALRLVIALLPATGVCELMCHPGLDDPQSPYRHWRYPWARELSALIDPSVLELLITEGISLTSYRELALSRRHSTPPHDTKERP